MANTSLKIDGRAVLALADRLGTLAGSTFGLAARDAVNEVTVRAHESTLRGMTADIGLTPAYVKSKTDVALTTDLIRPTAEVVTRGDLTILGRYPLQQLTQSARPEAKGDPSRGIAPGSKQAGVKATIRRSAPAARDKWFTMKLRAGKAAGDNVGVFVRATGRDKPKHIYGPSPYSLFRHQLELQSGAIADDLQKTAMQKIADRVEKALT